MFSLEAGASCAWRSGAGAPERELAASIHIPSAGQDWRHVDEFRALEIFAMARFDS